MLSFQASAILCAAGLASAVAAQAPSVGSTIANPAVLGRMFANVCISATGGASVERAVRGVGMIGNPETGTFFHQLFDMSVNASNGGCSMVFVTDQPDEEAMSTFRASVVQTMGREVPAMAMNVTETNGERYVRARIEVSW